jgi:RNAse (barnase) inhibitor barstar
MRKQNMTFTTAHLTRPVEPWILKFATDSKDASTIEHSLAEAGITARVLRGTQARTIQELMDEFASKLDFPEYFGNNWNALADCLTDLSWLSGLAYVVVIDEARYLLDREPEDILNLFLHLIENTSEQWAAPINLDEDWDRPEIPFHLLLCESAEHFPALRARIRSANMEIPDFQL